MVARQRFGHDANGCLRRIAGRRCLPGELNSGGSRDRHPSPTRPRPRCHGRPRPRRVLVLGPSDVAGVLVDRGGVIDRQRGLGDRGAVQPRRATATSPTSSAAGSTSAPPARVGPAGGPVPKDFTPYSTTFVSARTGWVLGAAPCSPCRVGRSCAPRTAGRPGAASRRRRPTVPGVRRPGDGDVSTLRFADRTTVGPPAAGCTSPTTAARRGVRCRSLRPAAR